MSQHTSKLARFWKELKRRRVVHFVTVYASAAFVIIELVNNLTEPLSLPSSLSTIVIIVLAVGFLPAIIISWIYDLSSGTLKRTRPAEELQEQEDGKTQVPNAWKIATYISFLVIVGFVVFHIITKGNVIKPGSIQSMVVLPFQNYTGDDQLEYFVAGMHSSLITDIGKVSGLRITSETTSNVYKNAEKTVPQIASELGVDAVVEGQVLCLGDTICLQVRVVTAGPEEKQLWVGDYREDKSKILSLYNRVTKEIADKVKVELTPEEIRLLSKSRIVDRMAYEDYLKARSYWNDTRKESLFKALEYLDSAIEKEPDWAPLYAGLAELWMWIQQVGYEPPSVAGPKILENLNKAMELDPDLSEVHYMSAMIAQLGEWNWEKSEIEFLKTLAINPNDSWTRLLYSQLLLILQRKGEALAQIELAAGLDPLNPEMNLLYSGTLGQAGDFEAALSVAEECVAADPIDQIANTVIEIGGYHLGVYDKVIRAVKYALPYSMADDAYEEIVRIYSESGIIAAYEEIMKQLEEYAEKLPVSPFDIAMRYIMAKQPEKAMDWIEKGFEIHDPQMVYITATGGHFEELFGNPRFIAICEKMNLPLPKSE
jgi:TolB-like protein